MKNNVESVGGKRGGVYDGGKYPADPSDYNLLQKFLADSSDSEMTGQE